MELAVWPTPVATGFLSGVGYTVAGRGDRVRVYLDGILLLNFLVDLLLLLGTNRLSGFPAEPRLVWAALLGAAFAACCVLPGFRFLGNYFWRLVSLLLMGSVAFGWNRSALRRTCIFAILSMALGGLALNLHRISFPALVLGAAGTWAICYGAVGGRIGGREYLNVEIPMGTDVLSVVALKDTGNTLRDPITGESVLVVSGKVAARLTGLTTDQLSAPLETLGANPRMGLRLIPYHGVGQENGMLLGKRFTDVKMGGRRRSVLVAFAPAGLGQGEDYQALTGGIV